jgi:hypothetical protein
MRAELFSSDFMISMFIFLSALLIIVFYYQNLQTDVYENSNRNDMMSKAIKVASLLAESSGYPQYWNSTNVQVIGLYDSGKFNLTKLEYLINNTTSYPATYQTVKTMLGTGVYNFFLSLKNTTGDIIEKPGTNYNYSYGMPVVNAEQTVLVKRLGMVNLGGNSTKVTLEVILWV